MDNKRQTRQKKVDPNVAQDLINCNEDIRAQIIMIIADMFYYFGTSKEERSVRRFVVDEINDMCGKGIDKSAFNNLLETLHQYQTDKTSIYTMLDNFLNEKGKEILAQWKAEKQVEKQASFPIRFANSENDNNEINNKIKKSIYDIDKKNPDREAILTFIGKMRRNGLSKDDFIKFLTKVSEYIKDHDDIFFVNLATLVNQEGKEILTQWKAEKSLEQEGLQQPQSNLNKAIKKNSKQQKKISQQQQKILQQYINQFFEGSNYCNNLSRQQQSPVRLIPQSPKNFLVKDSSGSPSPLKDCLVKKQCRSKSHERSGGK